MTDRGGIETPPARSERRLPTLLRDARKASKLTQQELADLLDVSQPTVAGWEAGRTIPLHASLLRLSEVLEVTVRRFLEAIRDDWHDDRADDDRADDDRKVKA